MSNEEKTLRQGIKLIISHSREGIMLDNYATDQIMKLVNGFCELRAKAFAVYIARHVAPFPEEYYTKDKDSSIIKFDEPYQQFKNKDNG